MSLFIKAAMAYATAGMQVFPLRPRQKKPYGRTNGLTAATSDVGLVAAWWAGRTEVPLNPDVEKVPDRRPVFAGPMANIGVATGQGSGFWVFDQDGPVAADLIAAMESVNSPLPVTPTQKTRNGTHRLFAWPAELAGQGRDIRNTASKLGDGIDVRGTGGYIVIAPSIHPDGPSYEWLTGLAFGEVPLAPAPDWLLDLVAPKPAPAVAPAAHRPRVAIEGRATRYGEAALTNCCRELADAPAGARNDTLFIKAAKIAGLCAGGEIHDESYARSALTEAGRAMCARHGAAWTAREEDTLDNGFKSGLTTATSAPERRDFAPAIERPNAVTGPAPAEVAQAVRSARELWAAAQSARDAAPVLNWLQRLGLDPAVMPGVLSLFKYHPRGPAGAPVLLAPLRKTPSDPTGAIMVFDLSRATTRPAFLGDVKGRALLLTEMQSALPLTVALDLGDAWALAAMARKAGASTRLAVTPTLSAFAGGALGDPYGRIDAETPAADPAVPPWLLSWPKPPVGVALALRGDLRTPELKFRKLAGGTGRERLEGEAAARFLGSCAEQHWRAAMGEAGQATHAVRQLRPKGLSFYDDMRGGA